MPKLGLMSDEPDLLDAVVDELCRRRGDLPQVAKDAGLSYDTVLRIKNRENDPGYAKVKRLAQALWPTGLRLWCPPAAEDTHAG